MQLTNARRKTIKSLSTSKGRAAAGAFVAEGTKCVLDTIRAFGTLGVYATADWARRHPGVEATVVKRCELVELTSLATAPDVLALCPLPGPTVPVLDPSQLYVALDAVRDPGNLGTIMRVCDWFGVNRILASRDTVDAFNPKVVMATMGSIGRVTVHYCDLPEMLQQAGALGMNVYGAFMDGDDIFTAPLSAAGIVVMGNEGRGISPAVQQHVSRRITIPRYPAGNNGAESLNVAMATGITVAQFRQRLSRQ